MKWPLQASLPCPSLCHSNNPAPLIPSLQDLCQTINLFIYFHHRENQTCQVTARHVGIGAGGSETPQDITWQRCFKRSHQWGQVYKVQNDQKEETYLLDPRIFPRCANKWVREVGATRLCCQFFFIYGQNVWPQAQGGYAPNLKLLMIKASSYSWHKHLEFSHSHRQTSLVISPGIWPWYIMMWRFLSSTQISNLLFLNNAQVHLLGADPLLALVRPLIAVSVRTCTCAKVT